MHWTCAARYRAGMGRSRTFWVYILTNRSGTLYVGVTRDMTRRLAEHRAGAHPDAFTARYAMDRLVYVEVHPRAADAIRREKQFKGWRRSKKVALIAAVNPGWTNLAPTDDT